jgi:hypothetical protein
VPRFYFIKGEFNMDKMNIPFQTIDWSNIPRTEHKGEPGLAYWQTIQFED